MMTVPAHGTGMRRHQHGDGHAPGTQLAFVHVNCIITEDVLGKVLPSVEPFVHLQRNGQ